MKREWQPDEIINSIVTRDQVSNQMQRCYIFLACFVMSHLLPCYKVLTKNDPGGGPIRVDLIGFSGSIPGDIDRSAITDIH